jgi:hypothetical protein
MGLPDPVGSLTYWPSGFIIWEYGSADPDSKEIFTDPEQCKLAFFLLPELLPMVIPDPLFYFFCCRGVCLDHFQDWTEQDQIEFVKELLLSMHHHQHG